MRGLGYFHTVKLPWDYFDALVDDEAGIPDMMVTTNLERELAAYRAKKGK